MGTDDQQHEPDDEVQLRVEDLRARAEILDDRPVTPSLVSAPRPSSHRAGRLLVVLGLVALTVAVVLAGDPALREGATGLARRLVPTPFPTLAPGVDRFSLLPMPPGVEVRLDGRALSQLPAQSYRTIVLSRGRHTFAWHSTWFPFQDLQCVVSVPPVLGVDTCPLQLLTRQGGWVIALHPSLATLARDQARGLTAATREALAAAAFTATVRAGDHYAVGTAHPPSVTVATATAPLRATLRLVPPARQDAFLPEPCLLEIGLPLSCHFPYQDCGQICTVPSPPEGGVGGDGTRHWIAAIGVTTAWTYATPGGRFVGEGGPDPSGSHLVVLRITWEGAGDGTGWHVAPLLGHTAGLPATDAAACDTPLVQLSGTTWGFVRAEPPPGARLAVASGPSPAGAAEGCVLVVVGRGTPPPVFLGRFGVLLTVNDAARNPSDSLPAANGAEQQMARDLMAQLQL